MSNHLVRLRALIAMASSALVLLASGSPAGEIAKESQNRACRVGQRYLEYLGNLKFGDIGDLFAEPTDYLGADGATVHHPGEVTAAYMRLMGSTKPRRYRVASLAAIGPAGCLVEFEVVDQRSGEYVPAAIDHFEVNNQGKIVRFLPYFVSSQLRYARDVISGASHE
jgi:hypothetical protein